MNLGNKLWQFTIGNASSEANSFTNTSSGGIGSDGGVTSVCPPVPPSNYACNYVLPATEVMSETLAGVFTIDDTAFVDEGSFSQGLTDSHVDVTFTYDSITTGTPEPASILLIGGGLLGVFLAGRKKLAPK